MMKEIIFLDVHPWNDSQKNNFCIHMKMPKVLHEFLKDRVIANHWPKGWSRLVVKYVMCYTSNRVANLEMLKMLQKKVIGPL